MPGILLPIVLLLAALSASAAESLGYSGRLVQVDGTPVSGPVTLRFELAYTDDTSTVICSKDVAGVALTNGVFHARLEYTTGQCGGDSLTSVLATAPTGETAAIRVTDVTNSKAYDWQALHAVPYALNAAGLLQLGATTGQVLKWDGSAWVPGNDGVGAGGTVTPGAGTVGAPGLSFSTDTDTGFFSSGANQVAVAAGGAQLFAFDVNGFFSPTTGGGSVASGAGTEALPTFAFAGDLDTGWFRPAANTLAASTGGSERLRVTNGGNLGIGTTSPAAPLDVSSGETITALFGADSNAKTRTDATSKQARLGTAHYTNAEEPMALIYASSTNGNSSLAVGGGTNNMNAATAIRFYTAANTTTQMGTERMAIISSGRVGVGVSSPTATLHLQAGASAANGAPLKLEPGTNLTTPEDGALEFDGTSLFFTAGGTRNTIPYAAAAGSLTNVTNLSNSGSNITLSPAAGTGSVLLSGAASTGTSSGALIVSGGVGVSGTINAAGNITSDGIITAVTSIFTPQLYGSSASGGDILIDGTSHATKGDVLLATAGTGRVGVGTASPGGKLGIAGGSDIVQLAVRAHTTQTTNMQEWQRGSDGVALASVDGKGRLTLFQGAAASGNNSVISYASSDNFNSASNVYGMFGVAINSGLGRVYGVHSTIETRGVGTVPDGVGLAGGVRTNHAGTTLTNAKALEALAPVRTSGAITNAYGVYVNSQSGASITNSYGVYSAGSSDKNYFAGQVGIGTASTLAPLHVEGTDALAVLFKGNTATGSPALATVLQLDSNIDYRGRGVYMTSTAAEASSAWFVGVPYTGEGFQVGVSSEQNPNAGSSSAYKENAKLFIATDGDVGIGTAAPASPLHIYKASGSSLLVDGLRVSRPGTLGSYAFTAFGNGTTGGGDTAYFGSVYSGGAKGQIQFLVSDGTTDIDALRIDASGSVGIGTTNPGQKFDILGYGMLLGAEWATGTARTDATNKGGYYSTPHYTNSEEPVGLIMGMSSSGANSVTIGGGTSSVNAATAIVFNTAANNTTATGTERMRIDSAGDVGIGVTDPTEKLEVDGNVLADAHTTPSDRRLKQDIRLIPNALGKILSLRGVSYRWREGLEKDTDRHLGVVAQEVQRVLPEAVHPNDEGILRVDYPSLIAPVIGAIKQLYVRLTADEARVRALNEKLSRLERQNALLEERLRRLEARPTH